LEISIKAPPEFVEPLSHIFYRYGYGGTAIETLLEYNPDEGESPPIPDLVTLKTYIPNDETSSLSLSNIEVAVKLVSYLYPIDPIQIIETEDAQWESKWKEYFHPLPIGKKMLICPTWRDSKPVGSREVIYLDPGMAFGTGHHPTTRMALELMEDAIHGNEKVIDYGCGSGILSIAAIKLGASFVTGLDIEADAVKVAQENIKINSVKDRIRIIHGSLPSMYIEPESVELGLANISAKVIGDSANFLSESLISGGSLILSGILQESRKQVESILTHSKVDFVKVINDGDWLGIHAIKR
jgi:ribosomal protein L11 methyltransferase